MVKTAAHSVNSSNPDQLLAWMESRMLGKSKFISPGDMDLFTVTDDPQEVIDVIVDYQRRVGPPEVMPRAFA